MALVGLITIGASAQRFTDHLNRGLVAIPQGDKTGQDATYGMTGSGIFVSWRKLATEYYDTQYNLYRDGTKINSIPLSVTNFQDNSGKKTSTYKVVPIVNGVEQTAQAAECKPWEHQYWEIPVQNVKNRNNADVTSGYTLNDCSVADVDGDGQMEFVVKRRNDSGNLRSPSNKTDFNLHECYKMDGTRLWWIDMGPNLMAGPDEQFDLVLYDWDQDGKAEALMRGADNMIIHTATGKTIKIGNMTVDILTKDSKGQPVRPEYMGVGKEYLLYINGATGEPYGWNGEESWTPMAYPLPQFESNETSGSSDVWGDLGHRMQKHYFGAPYIDGRNPAIFLGRGCYTRHKFCALSVNKDTHELTQLWRWNCYDSSSPWFGNGFHNFAIADVDMDGRDEIVFGSMMIDDTGYGLATTGYGHGDAAHCGDFDPYRWGLEQFVCLEGRTVPGVAYTNATTQQLRYTTGGGSDNGRCMAGNFYNTHPGAIGISGNAISLVADRVIDGISGFSDDHVNCRIYWDGDLLDEFMDSPGVERAPTVYKAPGQKEVGTNRSYTNNRCWMGQGSLNNSSKNNACFLGDIIGDWREEIVTRNGNKLIIQTTSYPSLYGITTLWADHEYRNAMTWQSVGYNQPPHPSFFLGELEGITNEPPAITLEGRTEVSGTIATTTDHLLVSGYENKTVAVQDGASPYILTVNTPAWVKGSGGTKQSDGSIKALASTPKQPSLTIETYTTTLTGGAFSGATRLVKQGEGVLILPTVTETYTGNTDVWQGTLQFDGTMESSPVWLNRHTTLISNGGNFKGGIKADYNATIYPGGKGTVGNITASTIELGFGSRVVIDCNNGNFDQLNVSQLTIGTQTADVWKNYGPRYKAPVLQFNVTGNLSAGTYELGQVGAVSGDLSEINIEGIPNDRKVSLKYESQKLCLVIENMRAAASVVWNGTTGNNIWQQAVSENFLLGNETTVQAYGDEIVFDDNAAATSINIRNSVSPKTVTFTNEKKTYTLTGDSIIGESLTKNGKGTLTMNYANRIGSTTVNGGIVVVPMLANNRGQDWGSLGNSASPIILNSGTTLRTNGVIITDQQVTVNDSAIIDVPSGKSVIFNKGIKGSGATLVKTSAGSMETLTGNNFGKLIIKAGTMTSNYNSSNVDDLPTTVQFEGGTLWGANMEDGSGITNRANFVVPKGKTGSFYASFRGVYNGTLTGEGTLKVFTGGVRCYFDGDWSQFAGTVEAGKENRQNKKSYTPAFALRNTNGLPNATLNVTAGTYVYNEGKNIPVGSLTGTGYLLGSGKWIVGSLNKDFTLNTNIGTSVNINGDYSDVINVTATPVEKVGTGKMFISAGKINGALTVSGGTVAFNDKSLSTLIHGGFATTINDGGLITGQGKLNTLTINSGGELRPCAATSLNANNPGTIQTVARLLVNKGGIVNFIVGTTNSQLKPGNMTFSGTVKVTLQNNYTPKAGDEFTLWQTNTIGNASKVTAFELPELPAGLYWDTTSLIDADAKPLKTGVLKITNDGSVGIGQLPMDANVSCDVYTTGGTLVASFSAQRQEIRSIMQTLGVGRGLYIVKMKSGRNYATETVIVK